MPEKKKPLFNAGPTEKKSTELTSVDGLKVDKELNTTHLFGRRSVWGPYSNDPESRQNERDELEKTRPVSKYGRIGDVKLEYEKKKKRR